MLNRSSRRIRRAYLNICKETLLKTMPEATTKGAPFCIFHERLIVELLDKFFDRWESLSYGEEGMEEVFRGLTFAVQIFMYMVADIEKDAVAFNKEHNLYEELNDDTKNKSQ